MIATMTPPSLDQTLSVSQREPGHLIRSDSTIEAPGGKGVNALRLLTTRGSDPVAVPPVGASSGRGLVGLFDEAGIPDRRSPTAGPEPTSRLVGPDRTATTKLNEPGPYDR